MYDTTRHAEEAKAKAKAKAKTKVEAKTYDTVLE
jgi:hypothetical protein